MSRLLDGPPAVVNVGLGGFAEDLRAAGARVQGVAWRPPGRGSAETAERLARLDRDHGERIAAANREALDRLLRGTPRLLDVVPAAEAIPRLAGGEPVILHAGPPIEWERMCGPLRGAIAGAAVFEGWADRLEQATEMAAAGAIRFEPNHHHAAVGPMTGMTTARMPVLVVENTAFGNRAYCTLNEGLGKVLRFGGNDAEVVARLRWMAATGGPALGRALRGAGGLALKGIVARGLAMGDEMHQRNAACTSLLVRSLAPAVARTARDPDEAGAVLDFMAGNDQLFLNVAMAMGKALADPLGGIPASSVVTAMSRNGTDFGIRLAATGEAWFTAPVEMPAGLYFPGFGEADANPDMGDSTIVETVGLGGFAMAAAPAVAGFVGAGTARDALEHTRAMYDITLGANPEWTIPALEFAGVPSAIDARLVAHTGRVPTINTGIAHREPGVGQVGAGVVRAPFACFTRALEGLERTLAAAPRD